MKTETLSFYATAVESALRRIASGLDDALDLAALARAAALSPLHFHHVFRGMVGETPLEVHRRLRLERAAVRLATGDGQVVRVAFEAGYETHESFTRAFRQAYAVSPSEYRARARAALACGAAPAHWLAARCGLHFGAEPALAFHPPHPQGADPMDVEILELPELTVAAVRHTGPYPTISRAFERLGSVAARAGLFALRGATMVATYHDDPEATPAAELRSDAGLVIPRGTRLPEELAELRLPAGRYACTLHRGPYTLLGDTWARLMGEWLPASGHRVGAGVSLEVYRNDPSTAAPADLLTEIRVPLA
ncbi:MAG: GyrI-like domain-containing protein [Deltaproteobacteria bacterium]|nr:GyrI-like domain-containing protein [Deltaproteobacteria bacterium]